MPIHTVGKCTPCNGPMQQFATPCQRYSLIDGLKFRWHPRSPMYGKAVGQCSFANTDVWQTRVPPHPDWKATLRATCASCRRLGTGRVLDRCLSAKDDDSQTCASLLPHTTLSFRRFLLFHGCLLCARPPRRRPMCQGVHETALVLVFEFVPEVEVLQRRRRPAPRPTASGSGRFSNRAACAPPSSTA